MTSRSAWGADESLVKDPPTYTGDTKAMFVHHTAGTNDYSCSESASIVRGVFLYHVQSNGWNDIGYHFLVDKCGTVFEGRAGGVDKPVLARTPTGSTPPPAASRCSATTPRRPRTPRCARRSRRSRRGSSVSTASTRPGRPC